MRGQGLAYSFTMYGDADERLCYFSLSRSPAVAKAYAAAGRLVEAFARCCQQDTKLGASALLPPSTYNITHTP